MKALLLQKNLTQCLTAWDPTIALIPVSKEYQ